MQTFSIGKTFDCVPLALVRALCEGLVLSGRSMLTFRLPYVAVPVIYPGTLYQPLYKPLYIMYHIEVAFFFLKAGRA